MATSCCTCYARFPGRTALLPHKDIGGICLDSVWMFLIVFDARYYTLDFFRLKKNYRTTHPFQTTSPCAFLSEKAETPVMESPVLLSRRQWSRIHRAVTSCEWVFLTSFPAAELRISSIPSCPAVSREALVKCLHGGCVVMATTWDQAREKLPPTVH